MAEGGLFLGVLKKSYYATTYYFNRTYCYRHCIMAGECFHPHGLQNQKNL
jgi:hypothetical protein